jgi:hypothetical protein
MLLTCSVGTGTAVWVKVGMRWPVVRPFFWPVRSLLGGLQRAGGVQDADGDGVGGVPGLAAIYAAASSGQGRRDALLTGRLTPPASGAAASPVRRTMG